MSLRSHITSLEHKHSTLDTQIDEENKRPMPDSLMLQTLRKQKLRIKEEIVAARAKINASLDSSLGAQHSTA